MSRPSPVPGVRPRRFTVALAGQPNAGKSTVFNLLTGLSQHVGNWPGKTVEQRSGTHAHEELLLEIVDLPGTYSLTAASQEEVVAREFLIRSQPDAVIAVINAAQLERHLYLVAELALLPVPLVVAVNMMDVAEREGLRLDIAGLAAALGVPVMPAVASRNQGIAELIRTVVGVLQGEVVLKPNRPAIRADHARVCASLEALVAPHVPPGYPADWVALKVLEGDVEITSLMEAAMGSGWDEVHAILRAHDDAGLAVAGGRYEWIGRIVRACVTPPKVGEVTVTERLDRWATHPVWGLGLLGLTLGVVYGLTFAFGVPLQRVIATYLVDPLAAAVPRVLPAGPWWLVGLLADGVVGGVGTVVSFVPILVIFFAALALIEDTGYMARAAYVTDRFMHLMGLHGKSSLPLLLGFGCNVPAVMGTRILESRRGRLLTIMLAPLVPCASRMTVVVFLAPIFFGAWAPLVAVGLIVLPLAVLAMAGGLVNVVLFKGQRTAFIMEMPLYHRPSMRTVGIQVWQSCREFAAKAGTLILVFSMLLWGASAFPHGSLESSLLAQTGRLLEPVGALMGLDWRMMVALLSSFFAKENAIATLGILFGGAGEVASSLGTAIAPASALAYLVAQMLFVPCAATVVTIRREAGGWSWALIVVGSLAVVSLACAAAVFHIAEVL